MIHVAALAWLATRTPERDAPASEAALQWIDIEVAPARPEPVPAPVPEPVPESEPERPDELVPQDVPQAVRNEPRPRPGSTNAPTAEPVVKPTDEPALPGSGASERAPGLLSMRATGPTAGPTEPGRDRASSQNTAVRLSPEQAARLVERDPGPPAWSPLAPPGSGHEPRVRSEIVPDGKGAYRADDLVFTAKIDRDGRVHIDDRPNLRGGPTSGTFDVTDAIMRAAGQDPYSQRKALFLDRTRDQRAAMSVDERQVTLRDSLAQLPEHLAEIWGHQAWSPAQRRRVLFELWDECAEQGPDDIVSAGKAARITIVAFIRKHLPAGSAHAYTEAEIRALDRARRSRQRFTPYP